MDLHLRIVGGTWPFLLHTPSSTQAVVRSQTCTRDQRGQPCAARTSPRRRDHNSPRTDHKKSPNQKTSDCLSVIIFPKIDKRRFYFQRPPEGRHARRGVTSTRAIRLPTSTPRIKDSQKSFFAESAMQHIRHDIPYLRVVRVVELLQHEGVLPQLGHDSLCFADGSSHALSCGGQHQLGTERLKCPSRRYCQGTITMLRESVHASLRC